MNYANSAPIIAECKDVSERIDLFEAYGLYIKPIARVNLTIQLPPTKTPGQTVSNAEILDKVKKHIAPDEFIYLRVLKTTLEFIRCEGEIENKSGLKTLLSKLDGATIKMNTYTDVLKVRAAESKIIYPNRHEWESFFKDDASIQGLDELNPGEKPDTVHISDLPCKWFSERKNVADPKPSELILRDVFSLFGEIRLIDVPMLSNPFAPGSNGLKKQFSSTELFGTNNINLSTFEVFIQYKDYISFVKAMDTFRGMKLLYMDENKRAFTANVRVDFDKTKHLSDKEIKKREIERLKLIEIEKIKNAQYEKEKEVKQKEIANFRTMLEDSDDEGKDPEKSKEKRRRDREEARRQKRLAKKQQEKEKKLNMKIELEERKILIAQRKLESMRLLEVLFNRVKDVVEKEESEKREKGLRKAKEKREQEEARQESLKKLKLEQEEQELKEKIEKNLQSQAEKSTEGNEDESNSGDEPMEEFELRKNLPSPLDNSTHSESSSRSPGQIAMPRAVLLSHQHQLQSTQHKAQLYEDEEANSDLENSLENQPSDSVPIETQ